MAILLRQQMMSGSYGAAESSARSGIPANAAPVLAGGCGRQEGQGPSGSASARSKSWRKKLHASTRNRGVRQQASSRQIEIRWPLLSEIVANPTDPGTAAPPMETEAVAWRWVPLNDSDVANPAPFVR